MTPLQTAALTLLLLLTLNNGTLSRAGEITATNEWQLVGENDTIPAGLHVKMDLSTGEKWARLVQDDDDESGNDDLRRMDSDGRNSNGDGALISVPDEDESSFATIAEEEVESKPNRDYEMMHRVMSKLPPEELDRFGGLPRLPHPDPGLNGDPSEKGPLLSISPRERAEFEARMEELWIMRQEELRKFQEENVADTPSVWRDRIKVLREYLEDPRRGREKVLEERREQQQQQQQQQLLDDANHDKDDADATTADDVVSCLKDLEYQLSDIDHARDFHTLGGWPYLIALLHGPIHRIHNCRSSNDDKSSSADNVIAHTSIMYEIQSLTAMTIGTAVGNLGEFHAWALEDVSHAIWNEILSDDDDSKMDDSDSDCSGNFLRKDEPITALFSLVQSFAEFNATAADIGSSSSGGESSTAINSQKSTLEMFRTSKLRAVYALGSLLRGNPLAQQQFVSENGPHILVQYALNALSDTTASGGVVTKLDYKLASKVLALVADIVMNILLQEDDYRDDAHDGDGTTISGSNQMIRALTTEPWCDLSLRMLSPPIQVVGESFARGMKERALSAIRALGPACRMNHQLQCSIESTTNENRECTQEESSWGVSEIMKVKSEWNREGSGDGLDSVYRRELLDLIDGVLEALQ